MSEWMIMETAPKDGDSIKVLLKFNNGEISVGYWDLYYAEGGDGYHGGEAWIEPISGEKLDMYYDAPIGWMPLP